MFEFSVRLKVYCRKMRRTLFWNLRWAWWLLVLTLTACSGLPRIIVLHDPLTPEEHATLGGRYEAQGLTKQATEEYHAALRKQPDNLPALIGLGNISYEQGKMKDAERYYQSLDRDPITLWPHLLASASLTLGKTWRRRRARPARWPNRACMRLISGDTGRHPSMRGTSCRGPGGSDSRRFDGARGGSGVERKDRSNQQTNHRSARKKTSP
jgi:hypothetical protein